MCIRKKKKEPEKSWYKGPKAKKIKSPKHRKLKRIILIVLLAVILLGLLGFLLIRKYVNLSPWEAFETDPETLRTLAPVNEEMASKIDGMPTYGEKDTWAIYMYMTGSDLEDRGIDELSALSTYLVAETNNNYHAKQEQKVFKDIKKFADDVSAQGVDLPQILYAPTINYIPAQESTYVYNPDAKGYASSDLNEISGSEFPENVKMIIQTGGAKRWQNSLVNPNRCQRFLVDSENTMKKIYDEPLVNMGDSASLVDYIKFCTENYPADHKIFVFWDHGGATDGACYDNVFADDNLTLRELSDSFEKAVGADAENPYFEAIGFDACLMSCAEVAHELYPYGRYLFASEESEPGDGWPYEDLINSFAEKPATNGAVIGKDLTDAFVESCLSSMAEYGYATPATFSIIDMKEANETYLAYCDFCRAALEMISENPSALSKLSRAAQSSIAYGEDAYRIFNSIDLGLFMQEAEAFLPGPAQKVLDALDRSTLYVRSTSYLIGSTGLSIYFPARIEGAGGVKRFLGYINDISLNKDVNALYYYKLAGCLNNNLRKYTESKGYGNIENIDYSIMNTISGSDLTCLGDGNMSMKLNDKELSLSQAVRFGLAWYDPETYDIRYFGEDGYAFLDPDGTISTNFNGKWLFFNGYPLPLEVVSETDEDITFRTSIEYNGIEGWLMTAYNAETDEYTLLGIREAMNEAGTANRSLLPLKDGALITIKYEAGNLLSNAADTYTELIEYKSSKTKLEECDLENGSYLEYIIVEDLRSDTYSSPIVTFDIDHGKISNQMVDEEMYSYDKQ